MATRKQRGELDGKIAGLYDMEDTIGKGHFAVVKLARHVFTGEKVAVKVIDKTKLDDISKAHLFQEVRCMKLVQHPNVVRLYEVIDTQTKLYLILELGDGGDMYDYIIKHKGLNEEAARGYFKQIVEAISYCHNLHVVHRDLKPENVVFFEKSGTVKVTDFGFSNMFNPGSTLETSCGSLAYSAPEILLGDSYDAPAVDVWSLGVLLYMLVCGEPPFQEANDSETLTMILDCKYQIPKHISKDCRDLINKMLKREPLHRAKLDDIVNHHWLMNADCVSHMVMPLISREHLCEEDHNYLISKMVEGNIATREEILHSLEKDKYDHITATFYLLAERRLKRQHQELHHHAQTSIFRKNSAPLDSHSKPHLEPLALSPRDVEMDDEEPFDSTTGKDELVPQNEAKKSRTTPFGCYLSPTLEIPISPPSDDNRQNYFVKSLTTSMTLDRKSTRKNKIDKNDNVNLVKSERLGSVSPRTGLRKFIPSLGSIPDQNTATEKNKGITAKNFVPVSKIQILKSFFERKVAAIAGRASSDRKSGFSKFPSLRKHGKNSQKERDQKADQWRPKTSIVQSLVSPPGTHPSPSTSPRSHSPERQSHVARKYSLIKEESIEDDDDDDDMDIDQVDLRPTKSAESLDDLSYRSAVPQQQMDFLSLKRPLVSVASSPQLLNQICEEHESDEEDDYVPLKIHSPRLRISRNSAASPEMVRKYEQRKKRGTGSRGTSCSSSDASDTDDTEGRSRKDKLKHKILHRRDSSDHSSDTDGGPSGPSGGNLGGSRGFAGSGGNNGHNGSNKKGGGNDGGGRSHKGGGSGGNHGSKRPNHSGSNALQSKLQRSDISVNSAISSLSLSSVTSKNSLKYIVERNESDSEEEDYMSNKEHSQELDKLNRLNSSKSRDITLYDFSKLADQENRNKTLKGDVQNICSTDCCLNGVRERTIRHKVRVKVDINRNGICKEQNHQCQPIRVETKCCSVV